MRVLLIASLLGCLVAVGDRAQAGAADNWRREKRCGVNALYGFLAIQDRSVSLADVQRVLIPGASGTSMLQLRDAAGRLGFPCDILRTNPEGLGKLTVPAIAHYSGVRDGHFVVILDVRPRSVVVTDLTACEVKELSLDDFKRLWSGYVLVKRPWSAYLGEALTAAGFVLFAAYVAAALRRLWRENRAAGGRVTAVDGGDVESRTLIARAASLLEPREAASWGPDNA
ncbi:MAG: cysteine peptidase family C39 domain-containing protein [Isosphaeraceae bacterium]